MNCGHMVNVELLIVPAPGVHDEKVTELQHLALSAALNVSAQQRADHTGVKVERNRSGQLHTGRLCPVLKNARACFIVRSGRLPQ